MKSLPLLSAITALGTCLAFYACSNNDGTLDISGGAGGSGSNGSGSSGSTPSSNLGGGTGLPGTSKGGTSGIITTGPINPDAACGSGDQPAELTPLYMVFLYDKSGSMGDTPAYQQYNSATRWEPMKAGMLDFFANSKIPGIQASLKFFPAPGDKDQTCHADYKTAAMVPLSNAQPLVDALNAAVPGGGTPTLPAVLGGIARARQLMAENAGSKAVVVLVTDGEPAIYVNGAIDETCAPTGSTLTNTIENISTVISAAHRETPPIDTYVIGIGEAQDSMRILATSGGTDYIQLDATQPPETTRTRLATELGNIRTKSIPCSMKLPTTFDPINGKNLVNVSFKHGSGTVEEFNRSDTCGAPGWFFDNIDNPTKIKLCPATCTAVQSDLAGTIQILLGCPTRLI